MMRYSELGRFGATPEHLAAAADTVDAAREGIIREWLVEAVRALEEGGWTFEHFSVRELEDEANHLLSRLAHRLRHDPEAPQTEEESGAFRLLGGPDLADGEGDVLLVSLFRLHLLLTHCVTTALLEAVPDDWSGATVTEVRAKAMTTLRRASGFPMPCQFVTEVETRLRQRQAETADVFQRMLRAQEDERKRMSRDVHDVLAQTLAASKYRAETSTLMATQEPERAREEMAEVAKLIGQTLQQVRDIIFDLHPRALDEGPVAAAVQAYVERMVRADQGIEFEVTETADTSDIGDAVKITLYRIAQEAVSNILRHSGARHAEVRITRHADSVEVVVRDEGIGFDVEQVISQLGGDHVGVASMQERCHLLGGRFSLRSRPGEGTRLAVSIPLTQGEVPRAEHQSHDRR